MALNFPPLPLTVGQQYTYNAITWFWNGSAWELLTATDAQFDTVTANSYNKVAITAPATSATITVIDGTTITLPGTTGTVALDDQQFYIGTTQVAINRTSASLSLTGISIDGNAGTVTDGVVTTGSYSDPSWLTISQSKVGLSNVTNESKATMFTDPTFTGTVSLAPATFESVSTSATAATGTVNIDVKTNTVFYYTASAIANWTFNFRADGTTALNDYLTTGKSVTAAFLVTQGVTAYFASGFTVDSNASGTAGYTYTFKWLGGSAPTGGNSSSIDSYSFTIIKTADKTFTILASAARFG